MLLSLTLSSERIQCVSMEPFVLNPSYPPPTAIDLLAFNMSDYPMGLRASADIILRAPGP